MRITLIFPDQRFSFAPQMNGDVPHFHMYMTVFLLFLKKYYPPEKDAVLKQRLRGPFKGHGKVRLALGLRLWQVTCYPTDSGTVSLFGYGSSGQIDRIPVLAFASHLRHCRLPGTCHPLLPIGYQRL